MSHAKLREDKTCLNCNEIVEKRYCPNCEQENIEDRQPFYYLFTHFIEDFIHYDGKFWKTIKLLLFHPGKLTKEYLAGKRQSYVSPVKLYIFVSFFSFLAFSLIPSDSQINFGNPEDQSSISAVQKLEKEGHISKDISQELINNINNIKNKDSLKAEAEDTDFLKEAGLLSMEQYDSVMKRENAVVLQAGRPFAKKYFDLKKEGLSSSEISDKFSDSFRHTLPKALFIYLPLFAFLLYLFHDKKKWWYFDHGVFTLHYFSFLLLMLFVIFVLDSIADYLEINWVSISYGFITSGICIYSFVYFFIAVHRVYETKKSATILKGLSLFILNTIFLLILLLGLVAISFLLIH